MTGIPYEAEVRRYLADCAAVQGLDRQYHPTADGAVKLIWHPPGKNAEDQVRAAFRALTPSPSPSAAPGVPTAGGRKDRDATPPLHMTGEAPDAHTA
jgi:hypothetical protein